MGRNVVPDRTPAGDFVWRFSGGGVEVKSQRRQRPESAKERIVKRRGFKNIRTVSEQVAEFDYRRVKCDKTYRF